MAFITSSLKNLINKRPQDRLFDYIKNNQTYEVRKLLKCHAGLLHEEYEHGKTVLEAICYTHFSDCVKAETYETIFDRVSYVEMNPNPLCGYKTIIHFAVLGQNPVLLEIIIKKYPKYISATAERNSPLHTLVKEAVPNNYIVFCQCIALLVKNGVDLNHKDKENKTALDWALEKNYDDPLVVKLLTPQVPKVVAAKSLVPMRTPMDYLYENDQEGFIRHVRENRIYKSPELYTCLSYVVENNLLSIIDFLIEHDAIKIADNETHPLLLAKEKHHHAMMERLLSAPNVHVPADILFRFIKRIDDTKANKDGILKCYQLIIDHQDVSVNVPDCEGNYPLHYAAKYGKWEVTELLLRNRASLANRNGTNQLAITDVDHEILAKHFDECIQLRGEASEASEENLSLTFEYATLLPCCASYEIKYPMKYVSINMELDQAAPMESLKVPNEMEVIQYLCNNAEKRHLLLHPLIISYVNAKWHKVETIVLINLILYTVFCISLVCYINYYTVTENSSEVMTVFWFWFLAIMTSVLVMGEIFQMIFMRLKYFKTLENYIEISLIVVVIMLMAWRSQFQHLQIIAALLAGFDYLFMLSNIPKVASYVNMFKRVTMQCCRVLLIFCVLILAFAFCFYKLMGQTHTDYGSALFKTMIMLGGEYNIEEFKVENGSVILQIVILLFIFIMSVVTMNLLIALAFADIQKIKGEAVLNAVDTRVQYITYVEPLLQAHQKITSFYLNAANQMSISLKHNGRIQCEKNKLSKRFCSRCMSWGCEYQLDKRILMKAKQIALKN